MQEKTDGFIKAFDQLNSGLNELLTYMGQELSSQRNDEEVEKGYNPDAISVYDAHFFDKPRIIIALNNVVGKLSKKDIAIMKEFDELYECLMAWVDGDQSVSEAIHGFIEGLQPRSKSDKAARVVRSEEVQSLVDLIAGKPTVSYDVLTWKAENILYKLNKLLERYYKY